jgi:uncharacterized membrane protein YhaH (DUF805 family)
MKWIYLFRNFDGRISRKTFWLMSISVIAIEVFIILISVFLVVALSIGDWWIEIIIVALIYPKFMIDVKRGHDRNIPMWVIGTVYAIAIARAALVKLGWLVTLPDQNVMTPINVISFLMSMLLGIAGLALLVELGFRKGRAGPNQYGPDPLANT